MAVPSSSPSTQIRSVGFLFPAARPQTTSGMVPPFVTSAFLENSHFRRRLLVRTRWPSGYGRNIVSEARNEALQDQVSFAMAFEDCAR
jgi:hypothetical protein